MIASRRPIAIAISIIACGIAAAPGLSCRAIAGVEERTQTCGGGLAPGACGVCQSEKCCEYARACTDRPECSVYRGCVEACGAKAPACVARCANDHAEGASAAAELDDCAKRQCPETCSRWSCIGSVTWPPSADQVEYTLLLRDSITGTALRGLEIRACSFADQECEGTAAVRSDANGLARVKMRAPQLAWVRVSGTEEVDNPGDDASTYQVLLFHGPIAAENAMIEARLISARTATQLTVGLVPDPTTVGGVVIRASDCERMPAAGVTFELTPRAQQVTRFYSVSSKPEPEATETSTEGFGGFLNVQPTAKLTVTAFSKEAERGFGTRQIFVKAGYVTDVQMPPMPEDFR